MPLTIINSGGSGGLKFINNNNSGGSTFFIAITGTPTPTPTVTPTPTPTPTNPCPAPKAYNITAAGNFYWTDCNGIDRYTYFTTANSPICICNSNNLPVSFDGGTGTLAGGGCECVPFNTSTPTPTPTVTPTPTPTPSYYAFSLTAGGIDSNAACADSFGAITLFGSNISFQSNATFYSDYTLLSSYNGANLYYKNISNNQYVQIGSSGNQTAAGTC
jgi:hypothetical protein